MGVTSGGRTRMQKGPPGAGCPLSRRDPRYEPAFIHRATRDAARAPSLPCARPAARPWHKKPSRFPHLKTRQGRMPPPQLPVRARTAVSRADARDKRGSLPARVATRAPQELPGHAGLL